MPALVSGQTGPFTAQYLTDWKAFGVGDASLTRSGVTRFNLKSGSGRYSEHENSISHGTTLYDAFNNPVFQIFRGFVSPNYFTFVSSSESCPTDLRKFNWILIRSRTPDAWEGGVDATSSKFYVGGTLQYNPFTGVYFTSLGHFNLDGEVDTSQSFTIDGYSFSSCREGTLRSIASNADIIDERGTFLFDDSRFLYSSLEGNPVMAVGVTQDAVTSGQMEGLKDKVLAGLYTEYWLWQQDALNADDPVQVRHNINIYPDSTGTVFSIRSMLDSDLDTPSLWTNLATLSCSVLNQPFDGFCMGTLTLADANGSGAAICEFSKSPDDLMVCIARNPKDPTRTISIVGAGPGRASLDISLSPQVAESTGGSVTIIATLKNRTGQPITSMAYGQTPTSPFTPDASSFLGSGKSCSSLAPCGSTLPGYGCCTLRVTFAPLSVASYSRTMAITYSDGVGSASAAISLVGIRGMKADPLNLSVVPNGTTVATYTVTAGLTNGSYPNVTQYSSVSIGNPDVASISSAGVMRLYRTDGTGTASLTVSFGSKTKTFSWPIPNLGGVASLSFEEGSEYPFDTASKYGDIEHLLTLRNTGTQLATNLSAGSLLSPFVFKGGTYPGTFGTCSSTLPPGQSCTLNVAIPALDPFIVSPSWEQPQSILSIYYYNGTSFQTAQILLKGSRGVARLEISEGSNFDFGPVSMGTTADHVFTLTNTGPIPMPSLWVRGSPQLSAPFSFKDGRYPGDPGVSGCAYSLDAGESCTVVLSFSPNNPIDYTSSLRFYYDDGNLGTSLPLTLSGRGFNAPTVRFTSDGNTIYETGSASVTAKLSFASSYSVTVPLTFTGTAISGVDYVMPSVPSITITAGSISGALAITLLNNSVYRGERTIVVKMGVPNLAILGEPSTHTVTILDVDPRPGAGAVDMSFGGDGAVVDALMNRDSRAYGVALQPDGKIVTVGYGNNGTRDCFAVVRYDQWGNRDSTFGDNGVVLTPVSASGPDEAHGVAIQPDGQIVVVGPASTYSGIVRYQSNGALDNTFGSGGIVTTNVSGGIDLAEAVVIQSGGTIAVAGTSSYRFALARYTSEGASLGTHRLTSYEAYAQGMAMQSDGRLVVVGRARVSTYYRYGVARFNEDGSADTAFGSGGMVITAYTTDDRAHAVAIQQDGKIIASRYSNGSNPTYVRVSLFRYEPNGQLDGSFADGGRLRLGQMGSGGYHESAQGIAVQPDGKIVIGGAVNYKSTAPMRANFLVARLRTDGQRDTTFGSNGVSPIVQIGGNGFDWLAGLVLQADGRIIAVGSAQDGGINKFVLTRYWP